MDFVQDPSRPHAGGHYSSAVIANGFIFVSGQLPVVPDSAGPGQAPSIPDSIEAQTRQVMSNLTTILRAAGSDLDKLVTVTIYLTDIIDWATVNRIYADILGSYRPARTIAVSPQLHFGCRIEVQATALVG